MKLIKYIDQSSVNLSLYLLFHVFIIYNESSQEPAACASLNEWTLVKRGDNQLQAGAVQQPQQPLMSSADVSALGAQRNFIGLFLPFREDCQNSQEMGNI